MAKNTDIQAAREYVTMAASSHPAELDWAEDVMLNHTTYTRRRYPGTMYVWADCSVVDANTGGEWRCDPWPSTSYPRAVLLAQLTRAKLHNQALTIGTQYIQNTPALVGHDGGDGIG